MNHLAMNAGGGALGGVPLMNNGTNGAPRTGSDQDENDFEARLNSYIYDYFLKSLNFDCARALLNSGVPMEPAPRRRDGDMNGADDTMHTDSKEDIDSKKPTDLPSVSNSESTSFLLDWFSCFWDFFHARTKPNRASVNATYYVNHQMNNRIRQEQAFRAPAGIMPGTMDNYQQMMRLNGGDLRQKVLQNQNRSAYVQPTQQHLAQMKSQQILQQQQARRDPSELDMNGQRPRTPSGDNAPSPSKRPRLEGVPFSNQMLVNGRGPPHAIPGQTMMDASAFQANGLLMPGGIPLGPLSQQQMETYRQQNLPARDKSIQAFNESVNRGQRGQSLSRSGMAGQGSPMQGNMEMAPSHMEFYGQQGIVRAPGAVPNGAGTNGSHALHDYQMQLMALEQQNKKRLLLARQEQDNNISRPEGQPGMSGTSGFATTMSPQGSRSGPSPAPSDQFKRGTPKMNPAGLPVNGGSPIPDGAMSRPGGSPAAMGYNSQMPPELYANMKMSESMIQMTPNGMKPPSSHPHFAASQSQLEMMRRAPSQMPNGPWPQGAPGSAAIMQQPQPAQQPSQLGTPQARSMPPPTAPPNGTTTNGRPGSPVQPAQSSTPQQSTKPNPKVKKNEKESKKRPTKKTSTAGPTAGTTSAADTDNPPPTPITERNPNSFSQPPNDGQNQPPLMQGPTSAANSAPLVQQPSDPNSIPLDNYEAPNLDMDLQGFGADLQGDSIMDIDFDSFLTGAGGPGEFSFEPTINFTAPDGVEAGAGDA